MAGGFVGGTGIAYPVPLTQIGIAIETAKGTLEAAPSYVIKTKAPKYKPDQTYLPDDTLQGSMVKTYDEILGLRYDSHGWDSYPYLDSFPILLCCEFGSTDTVTTAPTATTVATAATAGSDTLALTSGASYVANSIFTVGSGATLETHVVESVSSNTVTLTYPLVFDQAAGATVTGLTSHKFSLLNTGTGQPPSVSLWDYDGEEWRTMTACQLDELMMKGTATALDDYTCTWFGNAAALNASAPSVSVTDVQTIAPWTVQIAIGGTAVSTVVDWEFTFKRGVKPIPALTGTQEYFEYFADAIEATGKLTFVEQSGSPYLAAYEAGTTQSLDFRMWDSASGNLLRYFCTRAKFTTGELDRSKEWVEVVVDVQLLPSAADATAGGVSPGAWTVGNSVTTPYH